MKKHNLKKALVTTAAFGTVVGVAGLGFAAVKAETSNDSYPLIIQKLAETFNVSESEVQEVFVQTREDEELERLNKAVEDGDIKESQIDQILSKREDFKSDMDAIAEKSLTSEERRSEVENLREEYKTWAENNDIPVRMVLIGRGKPGEALGDRPIR